MDRFALVHRYAMVLQTDEPHPHVDLVVKAISEQGSDCGSTKRRCGVSGRNSRCGCGSSLTLKAQGAGDVLTLGDQVAFTDDTVFGAGGTSVFVSGNGTVVYNGTTDYQGYVLVNNANFKVNGGINAAPFFICRNSSVSAQRGTLSGVGTLTGNVFVNSGTIAPDAETTLTLGSLSLHSANLSGNTLGGLVKIAIRRFYGIRTACNHVPPAASISRTAQGLNTGSTASP